MAPSKQLAPNTAPYFPKIFIETQFRSKQPPTPHTNLSGHVAIVTGANTGLGLEAAKQLLALHLSHLVIAVRSAAKGEAAAEALRKDYGDAKITVWLLDMSSYESIQSFAERAMEQLTRLDIVILNAGIMKLKFDTNPTTGHEEMVQINYLSTVLLALLMIPVLKQNNAGRTTPGRLTISNASLALGAKFPNKNKSPLLASFDDAAQFETTEQYSASKLLAHLFLWELVEHVPDTDVIVNLADPGFVKGTEFGRDQSGARAVAAKVLGAIAGRDHVAGASTYVDAAVVKGRESHGCFLMSWDIKPFAAVCYTPEGKQASKRLWEETLKELEFAGVREIIDGKGL
ncbi:putative secondary metabolism biosynthetic enzyme [Diaporthe australafricana]|uniref:Secondary metabolism biosynthetic enzyme n=1 Tax=Diaporthe australafricana TaxID=127596 RepID=A0ABR3XP16_9PEZI